MPRHGQRHFLPDNARAVVLYPDQPLTAVVKTDINHVRSGVQAVFHQFLDDAGRAFYDLSRGNLITQLRRQETNMTRRRIHSGSVAAGTTPRKSGIRPYGKRHPLPRHRRLRREPEKGAIEVPLLPEVRPFDVDLLYVECSRCGAPVMWEGDRTARLLEAAGIDPLELDASCLLMTDACPLCGGKGAYTVQIYRIGRSPEKLLPPFYGNA